MFRFIGISLIFATLGLSPEVAANDENWFEVEVYVFSRDTDDTEQWPEQAVAAPTNRAIDLISPILSPDIGSLNSTLNGCSAADWATQPDWCNQQIFVSNHYRPDKIPLTIAASEETYASADTNAVLLAETQSQFKQLIIDIKKEPGVTGLLHMTWQENMKPRRQSRPIRIFAGKDFGQQYQADGNPVEADNDLIEHFELLNHYLTPNHNQAVWQLDGIINIYLNHWLYIETDLTLREEGVKKATPLAIAEQQNNIDDLTELDNAQSDISQATPYLYAINMKQNRRVRSDQMHYFDHPKLGLLIQIRKMEQPSERQQAETEEIELIPSSFNS